MISLSLCRSVTFTNLLHCKYKASGYLVDCFSNEINGRLDTVSRTLQKNVTFINHTSLDGSTEPWGILMALPSEPNYATVDCLQSTAIKDVRRIDFFIPSQRCLDKAEQQGVLALSHFNCAVRGGPHIPLHHTEHMQHGSTPAQTCSSDNDPIPHDEEVWMEAARD